MDTSRQRYESDASGWQRGLYDSIRETFRAPFVNWIFRTSTANYPEFTRYLWGQVQPVFRTEAFARFTVAYRDAVLGAVETATELPAYRRGDLGIRPAEYHQLRGQLATFDVVGPRLAALFELVDRSLSGGAVGSEPATDRAACAPFPAHLDSGRGLEPTMAAFAEPPARLEETVADVQSFHGLDEGLPSIYRCLVQWPAYFETVWADLAPLREEGVFEPVTDAARAEVDTFVASMPYRPQLSPGAIETAGFGSEVVEDVSDLFARFNGSIAGTVLPMLPVLAATVDSEGRRAL
jgi:hypothetical protein